MFGRPFSVFQYEFVHTFFVELSMAHLLKKIQDFTIYLSRDIDTLARPECRKIEKILHDSVATCSHPQYKQ
jgi:hypothetical protein